MISLDEIKSIIQKNKKRLQKKYGIKEIGIFGSYTRGDNYKDSDIDILVEFENPVGLEFVDLSYELEELLNHKVDLVSKKAIKTRLINYIKEDLIYV